MIEGSLEVKLPAIWTHGKAEVAGVKEEKRRREKIREDHWVFPVICGPGGSKRRLAKAAGAEASGEMRDQK